MEVTEANHMKQYIRTKWTFIGEPERIREITEELGTEHDPIRFERILPLEGEDPNPHKLAVLR